MTLIDILRNLDIMIEFEQPNFDNFMKLAFFLEDLFGKKVENGHA